MDTYVGSIYYRTWGRYLYLCMSLSILFQCISGNIALARSYMSAATLETERNAAMSMLASMQALGFILGPGTYI